MGPGMVLLPTLTNPGLVIDSGLGGVPTRLCSATATVKGFTVEPGSKTSVTARFRTAAKSRDADGCWGYKMAG